MKRNWSKKLKKIFTDKAFVAICLIIAGFFLEGTACSLYVLASERERARQFVLLLLGHLLGSFTFSAGTYVASKRYDFGNSRNWFAVAFMFCAFFPIAGIIVICVIFTAIATSSRQKMEVYDDYERYITFDYGTDDRRLGEEDVIETVAGEVSIQPLADVMLHEDIRLRRGAVSVMKRLPKKDAVRLLKMALDDKSVEIRFYAAIGISEIEGEITSTIDIAKKQLERHPHRIDVHVTLANSYYDYYDSGILDEITAAYYRDLALERYYHVCEMGGGNSAVFSSIARLESDKGNYEPAMRCYDVSIRLSPDDPEPYMGKLRVLYETGRFRETRKFARIISKNVRVPEGEEKSIVEFWAGNGGERFHAEK